jgi:hypothetical protein
VEEFKTKQNNKWIAVFWKISQKIRANYINKEENKIHFKIKNGLRQKIYFRKIKLDLEFKNLLRIAILTNSSHSIIIIFI